MNCKKANQPAKLWGCSVAGPLHIRAKHPNQDAWLARSYVWGEIVAVADGLGSKKHSDIGSKAACHAVVHAARLSQKCPEFSPEQFARDLHAHWLLMLRGYPAEECATTCLFAVRNQEKLLLGRLGDGMIAAIGKKAGYDLLLEDNKAESFANMTVCLRGIKPPSSWEIRQLDAANYDYVMLCTDGISDDIQDGLHLDFAKALLEAYAEQPYRVAYQNVRKCLTHWTRPGHTDDKTLAILNLNTVSLSL